MIIDYLIKIIIRELFDLPKNVVEPKPAATVVIIRNSAAHYGEYEVLMTKRQEYLKFLGGFYSFPGGKVELQDFTNEAIDRIKGIDYEKAFQTFYKRNSKKNINNKFKSNLIGYWTACIRELFEEVGILLAYDENNNLFLNYDNNKFENYRKSIINDKLKMWEMLENENLFYAADQLIYFNRFITPKISPKRFDTRFFLCKLPEINLKIKPYEKEISEVIWISPKDALYKYENHYNDFKIIFPQIATLKELLNLDLQKLERNCK